ncbi:MAG: hypothetical protein LBV06_02500 [Propionibacteriaceae bacterium]|nr:hypothetical protein [Propionibacteriaceae bacterium]
MDASDFPDWESYFYPGTTVLRNLFDEHNQSELNELEFMSVKSRSFALAAEPITGNFDIDARQKRHPQPNDLMIISQLAILRRTRHLISFSLGTLWIGIINLKDRAQICHRDSGLGAGNILQSESFTPAPMHISKASNQHRKNPIDHR